MSSDTCRMPNCENEPRGHDEAQDGFAAKFCSDQCEVKFDHLKADAKDARASEQERAEEEHDGPHRV